MRIRHQLTVSALIAALMTGALLLGLLQAIRVNQEGLQQQVDAQDVARDVGSLLTLTNEFATYAGERAATQWRLRHQQLAATVDRAIEQSSPAAPALLELRRNVDNLPPLFEKLVQQSLAPPSPLEQRRHELLVERLLTETQEVIDSDHRWGHGVAVRLAEDQRRFHLLVLVTPGLLLALLVALGLMVWRRVLRPLASIETAVTAIRAGDLSARCHVEAADELGDTARAVDSMAGALAEQTDALRASERHLRLVTDNMPALIGYIGADGRYAMVNKAYEAWHGLPLAKIVGQRLDALEDPDGLALFAPHLARAFAGEVVEFDADVLRRGRNWSMHINYIPQLDERGRTVGIYVLGNDLTALRQSERQLLAVMEASPLGMFHADAAQRCLYVNPAWLKIAGINLEQSLGDGWTRSIHPEHRAQVEETFRQARDRSGVVTSEHRYLRPDGREVWVRAHGVALREGHRVVGHIGTVEDITVRRELDAELAARSQELARSNAELEQFAYVASHDLQEPLRMVTSYTQLILRRHGEQLPADAREFMAFVEDGGKRAQALISDLLSLARVNSQGKPMAAVPLQAVLDEVVAGLRLMVQDSGAEITHDNPLPTVWADRRQLAQLLQNLLANALKFRSVESPRVHVGAQREPDGRWRISVADNGIGIEPKFHQRVFAMFQRLHLRDEYPGTGIGLAICKKVVERHGGQIGVDAAPGHGSTFWFTLSEAADEVGSGDGLTLESAP